MEPDYAKKILESHLLHELDSLKGDKLKLRIEEEVLYLFDYFGRYKLNEIVSKDRLVSFIIKIIPDIPISNDFRNLIVIEVKKIFSIIQNSDVKVEAIFPSDIYNCGVKILIDMEDARYLFIHQLLSSPIYSLLVSDILYNGIKNFVLVDNFVLKLIPSASTFVKMAQEILNKTLPKLEGNIDKTLKEFIRNNINNSIRQSEKFLKAALDKKMLKQTTDRIWEQIKHKKLSDIARPISPDHVEAFTQLALDFLVEFRSTPIFLQIIDSAITNIFKELGEDNIIKILENMGISKEFIILNSQDIICNFLENPIVFQYIENRIRNRFESFYLNLP
ncbi:MAG: hypothetical protein HQK78_06085 [Desulfobacterales bacterium]|nr:hypothetical protein [Desulfobacterales bacterium]